jgi:DNA processing protein
MSADEERAAWLRLLLSPGVGRAFARRLLARHGSAAAIFQAERATLEQQAGRLAAVLLDEPEGLADHVKRLSAWLAGTPRRHLLTLGDPDYPALLLQAPDPPLMLFAEGRVELAQRPAVAIVGSRRASAQGLDNARRFARDLAGRGFTIVSGMAQGIDGAAHRGALDSEASTIAVVGTGLDRVFPPSHLELAQRIAAQGLLLSEFPLDTPPLPQNFPMRNRIIAGLSLGTLVVEAAVRSGSLITARLAADMGREVFAVPGSIHAEQSRGCHALLRQGAKLVEHCDDVLEELAAQVQAAAGVPRSTSAGSAPAAASPGGQGADDPDAQDPVLRALGHDPATLDQLVGRTGWSAAALGARLLELELNDAVSRLPGGLFQRRSKT